MFSLKVSPRFGDVDGLGHINNTALPVWFEQARNPIYRIFTPDLSLELGKWKLILAKIEVEFLGELFYGRDVEIKTYILEVHNSSMVIGQEAWQDGQVRVKGKTVIIHYDFKRKKSVPIPEPIRDLLSEHMAERQQADRSDG